MIFHENRLLDSDEISFLISLELGKMSQNLSSTAVMIGALKIKPGKVILPLPFICNNKVLCSV